jgi:hypothetical protein
VNLYTSDPLLLQKRVQRAPSGTSGALTLEDRAGPRRERNNVLRDTASTPDHHRITTNEGSATSRADEHHPVARVERCERKRDEFAAKAQRRRGLREEFIGNKVEELKNMLDFTAAVEGGAVPFLELPAENLPELVLKTVLECRKPTPTVWKSGSAGMPVSPPAGQDLRTTCSISSSRTAEDSGHPGSGREPRGCATPSRVQALQRKPFVDCSRPLPRNAPTSLGNAAATG